MLLMIDMFGFLCRLGLHKWRYEDVVITSGAVIEPTVVRGREWIGGGGSTPPMHVNTIQRTKTVFTKRECLRCGIKQEKRISEDDSGNKTLIGGWEKTKKQ
jgi:hypothetical protein